MGKTGCLILHGFAGERYETEPLRKYLKRNGYEAYCPTLAGYEDNKKSLASTTYEEWLDSAKAGYNYLKKKCEKIIIIGFSMGGLIAVNLLKEYEAEALITLSTPVELFDYGVIFSNLMVDFKRRKYSFLKRYLHYIRSSPLPTFINLCTLLKNTRPLFREISVPCLVIQGKLDEAAKWKSAEYIYSNIKSTKKQIKYYDDAPHLICCYRNKRRVFNDILSFIDDIS